MCAGMVAVCSAVCAYVICISLYILICAGIGVCVYIMVLCRLIQRLQSNMPPTPAAATASSSSSREVTPAKPALGSKSGSAGTPISTKTSPSTGTTAGAGSSKPIKPVNAIPTAAASDHSNADADLMSRFQKLKNKH